MYDEIYGTSLVVFDDATSEYVGKTRFDLTYEAGRKLLDLINFNRVPDALIISNVDAVCGSKQCEPSDLFTFVRRHSILNAIVKDRYSKRAMPIEIEMKYDRIARSNSSKDSGRLESVLLNNIEILDVRPVQV